MADEIGSQAEYLDALAAAIRSVNGRLDGITRADLEARLGVGEPLHTGLVGVPRQSFGASQAASTLGNTEPVIGQTNLLLNPELVGVHGRATTSGATVPLDIGWAIRYVLQSGTAIDDDPNILPLIPRGAPGQNPFNTLLLLLGVDGPAASAARDVDVYFESDAIDFSFPGLPFLVAAARIETGGAHAHWTTADFTLQIYDAATSTVAAESDPIALRSFDATPGIRQAVAAVQLSQAQLGAGLWQVRLRLHLVSDGSASGPGKGASIQFGEAQLNLAYSPDPLPFAPIIGAWVPTSVRSAQGLYSLGTGGLVAQKRVATPKPTQTLTAATAIVADFEVVQISSAGAITITAAPTIANGGDGQMLLLVNVGSFNITLQDQGTLVGSNLRLTAAGVTLTPRDSIKLMYSSTVGDWVQVGNLVSVL